MLIKKIPFVLFLFIFLISCGDSGVKDGVINIKAGPEPKTIDPTLNSSVDGALYITHVFEGLTTRDKDNNIVPGVAESWDISDDYLTYTFHIRSNASWSDGKPVVADDFVYSWRRAVDPTVASPYSYQLDPIENANEITSGNMQAESLGVKALDESTLEVVLKAPTAYFLELTAFPTLFPLRRDIVEENSDTWTVNSKTYIGNGPFKLVERKIDDRLVMEKNTNYWNIEKIVPKRLVFVLMDNPTATVAGIKDGSLHFATNPPAQDIPTLREEGFLETKPYLGTYFYIINCTNEALKDPRVRKALTLAIDRNYIIENVSKGGQRPAGAWVPYGISDGNGDFRESGEDYYSIKKDEYEKNIEEARKLLAEAGYPDGKGFPVIEFKSNQGGGNLEIFEPIQQMWKEALNIDVTISAEEWAVFQQTRVDKNFDIAMHSWIGDYNDPMTFLGIFLSYSDLNHTSWSNERFDNYLKAAMSTGDENKRMKELHNAEAELLNDMPLIPIYFHSLSILVDPKLKDVVYDTLGMHRFFYAYMND